MPKRFLAVLVTLPLLAGLQALPRAAAQTSGPCAITRVSGETVRDHMKRVIRCSVKTFGPVRGGAARAICIADRESGLHPSATSPTGQYLGLYQHAATYWPSRFKTWTDPTWSLSDSALNGRSNSIVTIQMVHAAGGWKAAGWGGTGC